MPATNQEPFMLAEAQAAMQRDGVDKLIDAAREVIGAWRTAHVSHQRFVRALVELEKLVGRP